MADEEALRRWAGAFVDSLEDVERKPLVRHLEESLASVEDGALCSALTGAIREVEGGNSMSCAFAMRPDIFPADFVTVIRYGEMYGEVDLTLRRYADRPGDLLSKCAVQSMPTK